MLNPTARELFFADPRQSSEQQAALEAGFFRHLRLPNGTYKTTYDGRMPDVDAAVADALPRGQRADVLDVGVSSGVTTLELADALEARGIDLALVAVDIAMRAYLRRLAGVDLLCAPEGHVLQIATPVGARGRPHDPNQSVGRALLQGIFKAAERAIGGPEGARRGELVQLISPRLSRRPGVALVEHDVARPRAEWVSRFDLVRAANVLNRAYFDDTTLGRMLAHLCTYVRTHGILVLCRTDDDTRANHATVFRREPDDAFTVVARIGRGSELETFLTATASV